MGKDVVVWLAAGSLICTVALLAAGRARARVRRAYVRLLVVPYRTDRAGPDAAVAMFEALHAAVLARWGRRLVAGQGSVALEVHAVRRGADITTVLAVPGPMGMRTLVAAALSPLTPGRSLEGDVSPIGAPAYVLRL